MFEGTRFLWGSILLAGGRLYVSNLESDTFVVRAAPQFELLAKNSVGEPTYAALAPAHGELFLRAPASVLHLEGSAESR